MKINKEKIFPVILGVIITAIAAYIVVNFLLIEQPVQDGIIKDWERICFWQEEDGLYADVFPKGCYSTSCTRPKLQVGTAIVDVQNYKIQIETRFVLVKTGRFPIPCTKNCNGGGTIQFKFDPLLPNDYSVWFRDERVGDLMVFSGRPTPRQCFENTSLDE